MLYVTLRRDISQLEREQSASGVMMIPIERDGVYEGVEGVDCALDIAGVEEIAITPNRTGARASAGGIKLSGIHFRPGGNTGEVEQSMRQAHARLRFQIAERLPVMR